MSTGRQTVRDLVEEGKKRIVLLFICVIGLSYLMSLTSSSVWVNLPAAASLIVLFRYISYDLDIRRRTAAYTNQHPVNRVSQNKSQQGPMVALEKSNWRRKVNSPVVEAAIDQFTSHLVSEWVADLWYSRLTPDKDGPEELVQLMNGVLGEVSIRVRDINLINLLTRDIINLICSQLELYRSSQAKIEKHEPGKLSIDHRDIQLKLILASENKLHPAMFSAEAEHRVLQLLMSELISFTFKHEDLQCSFFRYTVRELLVCAVMRPVLNLANPRFINERIESLVLSITSKAHKGVAPSAQEASQTKPNGSSRPSSDQFSRFLDRSNNGVELVQFKNDNSGNAPGVPVQKNTNGVLLPKDSDMKQTLHPTNSSFLSDSQISDNKNVKAQRPGAEWGQMLDVISSRKTQALAPEHFENMWTKGRNYKKKEGADLLAKQVEKNTLPGISGISERSKVSSKNMIEDGGVHVDNFRRTGVFPQLEENLLANTDGNGSIHTLFTPYQEKNEHDYMRHEGVELESDSSCPTEDDESSTVTGLDSPGTKVWDSKNKKDVTVSHIRHPLESSEGHLVKNSGKDHVHYQRLSRNHLSRKRSRLSKQKVHIWQEVERTSFLLGDGQDILNTAKGDAKAEESSDDPDLESWGRIHSGAAASSSLPLRSISDVCSSFAKSSENSVLAESFLKLRCEVLGANIVKSGSRTFAVYSISVTDADNNCWSIKRRFRHFEELHRCLKEFPEYNLSLPPKHFLSSGLDAAVVQERCKLLDIYLKKLLQLPTVSRSIEVWDFLSVDSQMYMFSNSLSIIQTLSVDLDDKPSEKSIKVQGSVEDVNGQLSSKAEDIGTKSKESNFQMKQNYASDSSRSKTRNNMHHLPSPGKVYGKPSEEHSGCNSDSRLPKNVSSFSNTEAAQNIPERGTDSPQVTSQSLLEAAADPTLPTEWVPPNLSVPILDLVDVIFQLQDGGWIRRQAFWVAKQVLQLGMGDAFDDWLIEKIQLLRRGSVIASAIKRIEQILWPDGIFITKHPKRQRPPPSVSQSTMSSSPKEEMTQKNNGKDKNLLTDEEQRLEAVRRATFVYELMIDKAPAAFVGLFGRKEYEQCVQDVYFFLQSPLCLKQLAYGLLELLLLAAFPEFDDVVKRINEEKDQFGEIDAKKNS